MHISATDILERLERSADGFRVGDAVIMPRVSEDDGICITFSGRDGDGTPIEASFLGPAAAADREQSIVTAQLWDLLAKSNPLPMVPVIRSVGRAGPLPWIVTEKLDRRSIAPYLPFARPLAPSACLTILRDLIGLSIEIRNLGSSMGRLQPRHLHVDADGRISVAVPAPVRPEALAGLDRGTRLAWAPFLATRSPAYCLEAPAFGSLLFALLSRRVPPEPGPDRKLFVRKLRVYLSRLRQDLDAGAFGELIERMQGESPEGGFAGLEDLIHVIEATASRLGPLGFDGEYDDLTDIASMAGLRTPEAAPTSPSPNAEAPVGPEKTPVMEQPLFDPTPPSTSDPDAR